MAMQRKTVWGNKVSGSGRTFLVLLALVVLPSAPLWAQADGAARLPDSLKRYVASKSTQPVEVIVHGTADEVNAVAARHGVRIKKRMSEGAVLLADSAQIESLSADVDHLSSDVVVRSFMSVTNTAIGADQVQAGLANLTPYTGAGIGVALIDSGIWTGHRALAGRVVFAKDFTTSGNDKRKTLTDTERTSAPSSPATLPIRRIRRFKGPFAASRRAPTSSACG
jgi:hypothetical protein